MSAWHVGLDFDNTLADYDTVFAEAARAAGLVEHGFAGGKREIRAALRAREGGEEAWMSLQGRVYGALMPRARLMPGAGNFLKRCRKMGARVSIVSHKTEYGHFDAARVNLRDAARAWMADTGFFDADGFGFSPGDVFFENDRASKISRIAAIGCTHFVDDLEEVFREPGFPAAARPILFDPGRAAGPGPYLAVGDWQRIGEAVFGAEIPERVAEIARALTRCGAPSIAPAGGGGNSRVFRVVGDGIAFALKLYPPRDADPRDRLGAESGALRFLAGAAAPVPRAIAVDPARNAALLEWIEGETVGNPSAADVDAAVAFLGVLAGLRHEPAARNLPLASEACLSAAELEDQVARRISVLREAAPELSAFLRDRMAPAFAEAAAAARRKYAERGLSWDGVLAPDLRALSPSDFGFHNAIRRPGGTLAFLDFEYFGWDDPVKLTADVLLHPGMNLPPALKLRFLEGARALYGGDRAFVARLSALYPLFGLRWGAILLNEFLPERRRIRAHAGELDPASAQVRQRGKAEALLARIENRHDDPVARALES